MCSPPFALASMQHELLVPNGFVDAALETYLQLIHFWEKARAMQQFWLFDWIGSSGRLYPKFGTWDILGCDKLKPSISHISKGLFSVMLIINAHLFDNFVSVCNSSVTDSTNKHCLWLYIHAELFSPSTIH